MTASPHFSLPFRFTPQAAVTAQDSVEEIVDCVLAILLCPTGYRVELPEFGIDNPVFTTQPVDVDALRTAIALWEPRAAAVLDSNPDALDALIAHVTALVGVRTQE
jgi:phage baseplate assembly protein W